MFVRRGRWVKLIMSSGRVRTSKQGRRVLTNDGVGRKKVVCPLRRWWEKISGQGSSSGGSTTVRGRGEKVKKISGPNFPTTRKQGGQWNLIGVNQEKPPIGPIGKSGQQKGGQSLWANGHKGTGHLGQFRLTQSRTRTDTPTLIQKPAEIATWTNLRPLRRETFTESRPKKRGWSAEISRSKGGRIGGVECQIA